MDPPPPATTGQCALCLRDRELILSHILPAWVYKRLRRRTGTEPVIIADDVAVQKSDQIREHLLCAPCDQRLGDAEDYLARVSAQVDGRFPLRDQPVLFEHGEHQRLSLDGLDVESLVTAGLGIVWKAAVCRNPNTGKPRLGPYAEAARRYLLGEARLPRTIQTLIWAVRPDTRSNIDWYAAAPFPITFRDPSGSHHRHRLLVAGVYFEFRVGRFIAGDDLSPACAYHGDPGRKGIFTAPASGFAQLRELVPLILEAEPKGKLAASSRNRPP
jgi:hypothetical protein